MPTTIPYDPTLVLGNIVSTDKLDELLAISAAKAPVDDAEENLKSMIALKRSVEMTIKELEDINTDTSELVKDLQDIDIKIKEAELKFAQEKAALSAHSLQSAADEWPKRNQ